MRIGIEVAYGWPPEFYLFLNVWVILLRVAGLPAPSKYNGDTLALSAARSGTKPPAWAAG